MENKKHVVVLRKEQLRKAMSVVIKEDENLNFWNFCDRLVNAYVGSYTLIDRRDLIELYCEHAKE